MKQYTVAYLLSTAKAKKIFRLLTLSSKVFILPSVIIAPSNMCNYNCLMCSDDIIKKGSGTNGTGKVKEILDFDIIAKVIDECSKLLYKPRLVFTGYGEPLIYPEIKEVMQLCKKKNIQYTIDSNGHLLDKYAESLVLNKCHSVNISLHGDESAHNRISRVENSFNRITKGLKKLSETKERHKQNKPLITINCVITKVNIESLPKIIKLFERYPINALSFQHLIFSEAELREKADFLILNKQKLEKLVEFINYIRNTKFPFDVYFYPDIRPTDIIGYYTDPHHPFKKACILPWITLRIFPNTEVKLCGQLLGNLKKDSLRSILNNKSAQFFRETVRKGLFKNALCFRCCHRHY